MRGGGLLQLLNMCTEESSIKFSYMNLCAKGSIVEVEEFLSKNKYLPPDIHSHGFRTACRNNRTEIINLCVRKNIHSWNDGLYGACCGEHFDLADALIHRGARCSSRLLTDLCRDNNAHAVKFLFEHEGAGAAYCEESLEYACIDGYLQIVELLVQKSYSEFQLFNKWHNIIVTASIYNHIDIIKYVMSQCPYIQTLDLSHALHETFTDRGLKKNMEIIKLLVGSVSDNRNRDGSIVNLKLGWKYVLSETKHCSYESIRLVLSKCNMVEYNSFIKHIGKNTDNIVVRYMYCVVASINPSVDAGLCKLLSRHPPYIVLLGKYFVAKCSVKKRRKNRGKTRKNSKKRWKSPKITINFPKNTTNQLKRLPVELLRRLYDFWIPTA